ncbi:MAG: argininosuccinate lyase, partial [Deltaproteobacteria bacterium]|nr:argininosuccinate lyase [Deltaproteobacteria bacterium]
MSKKPTRLWQTAATSIDEAIAAFTVGDDPQLDQELLPYDCLASAAHAAMLTSAGILTAADRDELTKALREAYAHAR